MKSKINYKNIFTVYRKELITFIDNPASYVVALVFLLLWFFIFFRSAFVVGESSLTSLFTLFPWFGLILISAITMGAIAKERDDNTLEFVLTHPIREIEFVLGKILSGISFIMFIILFTLPLAVVFSKYGNFDWGVYGSQLIGLMLFSSALISLGVFLSSIFNSQVAALLSTLAIGFLLILAGSDLITISLPFTVTAVLERVSLLSHYDSIIRGVLDFYDVLYFVVFIAVFSLLTLLQLFKRKYGDYKGRYSILQSIIGVLIVVAFLASSLRVWLPLRLDLTQGRVYTLSPQTKKILKGLPEQVKITIFASEALPSQYAPVLRDIKYVLGDYKVAAGSKVSLETKDPAKNVEEEQLILGKGIQKVQFNVIGQEELQLKNGYLGILIEYKGKEEVIPFINTTNDLEYQVTSLINKLATDNKPTIAFLNVPGSKTLDKYNYLAGELQKQFEVTTILLSKETPQINDSINTLVIAGGAASFDDIQLQGIKEYLAKGHNLIVLTDGYEVSNNLTSTANEAGINKILSDYGVTVNKDIVFDLSSYSRISFNNGMRNLVAAYPYWVISEIGKDNPIGLKYVQSVTTFWPSSITIDQQKVAALGYQSYDLITTTENAGSEDNPSEILAPTDTFPATNKGKKVLGVVLGSNPQNTGNTMGRVVVIGDSDFLVDNMIQRNPENMALGPGIFSWASQSESLADIQVKGNSYNLLRFKSPAEPSQIKFGVYACIISVLLVLALSRFTRRKALRYQKY